MTNNTYLCTLVNSEFINLYQMFNGGKRAPEMLKKKR